MSKKSSHIWQFFGVIIAALIGGTYGYMIQPKPEKPPEDVPNIISGYSNGTITILNEWRVFSELYPDRLSQKMQKPISAIMLMPKDSLIEAHNEICEEFKYILDDKLKAENANPIDINPKIRAYFGEIEMDGGTTVEKESRKGLEYCNQFFDLNLDAIVDRKTLPVIDTILNDHISQYIKRRQEISDLCNHKVASWYQEKAGKW